MLGLFRRSARRARLARELEFEDSQYDYSYVGYGPPHLPQPPSLQPQSPLDLPLRNGSTTSRALAEITDSPSGLFGASSLSHSSPVLSRPKYHDAEISYYNSGRRAGSSGRHCRAPWYIDLPELDNDLRSIHGLCENCQHINFDYLFFESNTQIDVDPEDYIRLGCMLEIEQQSCPFCSLVAETVRLTLERDEEGFVVDTVTARKLLGANWYLTPFQYSHKQYGPGYRLLLFPNIREEDQRIKPASNAKPDLRPDWPYSIRLLNGSAQGGRRIPAHHLDFEWIRLTFQLCDLSTDMPPRSFQHGLRAIDVYDMCIVDLPLERDYVALSYCWGKVQMLTLSKENQEALRSPSSLISSSHVPQTIRDAIVLVRKVGLRYLWVDSLCVIQDDPQDMANQLQQMGEVYTHSYFTIFAISGHDVEYGLPGVRWGSRNLTQVTRKIGDLTVANCLPWMEEDELVQSGSWGSRAWTYQERFNAQRGLFIGDKGMIINCLHTYGPEDQHCMHEMQRTTREDLIATGSTIFYSGLSKSCEPYIRQETPFDMFAVLISEYSQRQLTFQSDAGRACSAVFSYLRGNLGCKLIHGMPDTELDAALLWSPIGSSVRRLDPKTGAPLFPSWSWLGWQGHAAWPWQVDRDTSCTTVNTPILWLNALFEERNANSKPGIKEWLAPEELCLPPSIHRDAVLLALQKKFPDRLGLRTLCDGARRIHPEWLSKYKIDWPNNVAPPFSFNDTLSHKLTLRGFCATFYVVGKAFRRTKPYNAQHFIWRLSVIDENARLVGYIDVPDPSNHKTQLGSRLFVALSRSTINTAVTPGPDMLQNSPSRRKPLPRFQTDLGHQGGMRSRNEVEAYRHDTSPGYVDAAGNFDTEIYSKDRSWCMFNVMMLRKVGPPTSPADLDKVLRPMDHHGGMLFEREAIGRIHVDAFDLEKDLMRTIELV